MRNIIIVLLSIVLLSSCSSEVGIQADETQQKCKAKVISKEQIANLLASNDPTGVQFIDIRTPHQFAMGHLPKAINIPQKNFFDEERFDLINKDDMIILYGHDASSPKMMALMSSHFKKGDFYIALGGYNTLKENFIASFDVNSDSYDDEVPVVDYQKEIDEIVRLSGSTTTSLTKKKPTKAKPLIVRKKKAVSGGCG